MGKGEEIERDRDCTFDLGGSIICTSFENKKVYFYYFDVRFCMCTSSYGTMWV